MGILKRLSGRGEDSESSKLAVTIAQMSSKTEAKYGIKIAFAGLKDDTVMILVSEGKSETKEPPCVLWHDLSFPERQFALEEGMAVALKRILGKKVDIADRAKQTRIVNPLNFMVAGCTVELVRELQKLLSS
jgi:hypothetical protein